MREVKGYVFGYSPEDHFEILFGKSIGNADGPYENFEGNGHFPFGDLEECTISSEEFRRIRKTNRTRVGKIKMKIAETVDEFDCFKDKSNLIVIQKGDHSYFLGP